MNHNDPKCNYAALNTLTKVHFPFPAYLYKEYSHFPDCLLKIHFWSIKLFDHSIIYSSLLKGKVVKSALSKLKK